MRRHVLNLLMAAALSVITLWALASRAEQPTPGCKPVADLAAKNLRAIPENIPIGLFYGGTTVNVEADLPRGGQARTGQARGRNEVLRPRDTEQSNRTQAAVIITMPRLRVALTPQCSGAA